MFIIVLNNTGLVLGLIQHRSVQHTQHFVSTYATSCRNVINICDRWARIDGRACVRRVAGPLSKQACHIFLGGPWLKRWS